MNAADEARPPDELAKGEAASTPLLDFSALKVLLSGPPPRLSTRGKLSARSGLLNSLQAWGTACFCRFGMLMGQPSVLTPTTAHRTIPYADSLLGHAACAYAILAWGGKKSRPTSTSCSTSEDLGRMPEGVGAPLP